MLGATLSRSVVATTCWRSSASALSAVIATGVSCRLSARRRAVTMTDSMASAPSVSVAGGGDCGHAGEGENSE